MCIITPPHPLFFFLKQPVEKKEESVGRREAKKKKKSCWQNWNSKMWREGSRMDSWRMSDLWMMVKKRGSNDEKEGEAIRKESGGRRESCCTSPAEEAECWTSWTGLLITQTHSLSHTHKLGSFPHWPSQILFLRNTNELDQRTLFMRSWKWLYRFLE